MGVTIGDSDGVERVKLVECVLLVKGLKNFFPQCLSSRTVRRQAGWVYVCGNGVVI